MGFPRHEFWSGLILPGDLPHPGIKPASPAASASAGGLFTTEPPGKPCYSVLFFKTTDVIGKEETKSS